MFWLGLIIGIVVTVIAGYALIVWSFSKMHW